MTRRMVSNPNTRADLARGLLTACLLGCLLTACLAPSWGLVETAAGAPGGAGEQPGHEPALWGAASSGLGCGQDAELGLLSLLGWGSQTGWLDGSRSRSPLRPLPMSANWETLLSPGKSSVSGDTPLEQWEMSAGVRGVEKLNLRAAWDLAPGASIASRHQLTRGNTIQDLEQSAATTETTHSLSLALGPRSQLTASLADQLEQWSPQAAKPGVHRRTRALEFKSDFGQASWDGGVPKAGLRLALSNIDTEVGGQQDSERNRELHLNLAPLSRLRLSADYLSKNSEQNGQQATRTLGAVLNLNSDASLTASLKNFDPGQGADTRESSLKLSTRLGGGSTSGMLQAEEKLIRAEAAGNTSQRNWSLTGAVGSGREAMNLRASFEEKQGDGASGELARKTLFHIDRAFGPRFRLSAERNEQTCGTNAAPEQTITSACRAEVRLSDRTKLGTALTQEQTPGDQGGQVRELSLAHQWGKMELRAEQRVARQGDDARSESRYTLSLPTGELPQWAKSIWSAHEFEDATQYLLLEDPGCPKLDMRHLGSRVRTTQRGGGDDGGLDTVGFSHARIVGRRYLVQLAWQQFPEAESGEDKGRPMPVRRKVVALGTPISTQLTARANYHTDAGLLTCGQQRHGVGLALWGRLSKAERVEASVSHDSGQWEDGAHDTTRVSLLYTLDVSEDHKVNLKAGYGWGNRDASEAQPSPDRDRECRFTLGYEKAI